MSRRAWLGLAVLGLAALLTVNYLRPVPAVAATQAVGAPGVEGSPPGLPWPDRGQAAIGAEDAGVLAATAGERPQPIASVAKVMTALVVLEARALAEGEAGPLITVLPDDVATLRQEQADGESVVAVQAGEQLTEYQALQAVLIPSGNNVAALLGRWASGSLDAHVRRMNARARELGLRQTSFADASGFSPQTVSTASDLVRLGEAAMKQPVLADIVARPVASLPVAGTVYNVNYVLGQGGIVGIKTGNIPQGGACFLFAGTHQMAGGRRVLLLGAVMGQPTLDLAFDTAKALLQVMRGSLQSRRVVARGQVVGRYAPPWGGGSDVVATEDLEVLAWPGSVVRAQLRARPIDAPLAPGAAVGMLRVTVGEQVHDVPVTTTDEVFGPGRLWRLTRLTF